MGKHIYKTCLFKYFYETGLVMASKLVRAGSSYLRKLNQNSNVATRHVHRYLCPTTFAIAPKFHQSDFQRRSASLIQLRQYSEKPSIKSQIDELVQSKPVVVFMKGTPRNHCVDSAML